MGFIKSGADFRAQQLSKVDNGQVFLDITEATGIYKSFVGGHNKMVDILHQLADGTFVEHCFCIISRPQQAAVIKPQASEEVTG